LPRSYYSRTFLFKTCIAAGVALGIILLAQTIWSYIYVSQTLTIQEVQTDALRKAQSIAATTRDLDAGDPILLNAVLEDRLDDWKDDVAWIQITDGGGRSLATAGIVPKEQQSSGRRGQGPRPDMENANTEKGQVTIARVPLARVNNRNRQLRSNTPSPEARSPGQNGPPARVEVAVFVDSISRTFDFLLRYLIIGVSASLALMGSLVFIAVRFNRYVRGQQIEGQLDLARRVQTDMLPVRSKTIGRIDFAADCIPAWDVGGDYCDVFNLGGGCIAIVIGDISGKGISAALLMALIHGAIQSISWTRSPADHELASRSLNALLCKKTATERYSSLFWGYYEPNSSMLRYVNAGHPPPILFRRNESGAFELLRLENGGPVLGLLPEGQYEQGEQRIMTKDLLVAFSDGIIEAPNAANEEFGETRLIGVVQDAWNTSPENIRDAVLGAVRDFVKDAPVADDQTLVVVRFNQKRDGSDPPREFFPDFQEIQPAPKPV
jgi:serine phosphatase RsbU (regulator of sigma subunit)